MDGRRCGGADSLRSLGAESPGYRLIPESHQDRPVRPDNHGLGSVCEAYGLPVVERLDGGESAPVRRRTIPQHVEPASVVSRSGNALVEHVQIEITMGVDRVSRGVDVTAAPVLHVPNNSNTISIVTCVEVPIVVEQLAISQDVTVSAILKSNGAPVLLEVAAPAIPSRAEWRPVRPDVHPAILSLNRRSPFVEAPCLQEPILVRSISRGTDVVGSGCVTHRSEAGRVELLHGLKATVVQGATSDEMVRQFRGDDRSLPLFGVSRFGRRILQVWHRRFSM